MTALWRAALPSASGPVQHLLRERGSFTRALSKAAGAAIQVKVLAQRWRSSRQGRVMLREVLLQRHGEALVFAATMLPWSALRGRNAHLRQLQTRPLGEMLFNRQIGGKTRNRRLSLELAQLSGQSWLRRRMRAHGLNPQGALYVRRSLFVYNGAHLLVHEVLLPVLLSRLENPFER